MQKKKKTQLVNHSGARAKEFPDQHINSRERESIYMRDHAPTSLAGADYYNLRAPNVM